MVRALLTTFMLIGIAAGPLRAQQPSSRPTSNTLPSVSPDGSRIVFVSDRDSASALFVIGVDGADERRLATGAVQRGRWGGFTDLVSLDVADSVSDTSSLAAGGVQLPPGITADAALDVQGWAWTTAATHRALETPRTVLDVFAGARLLDLEGELEYEFSADFGPFVGPLRSGSGASEIHNWDAIAGVKGRFQLDARGRWFVPCYLDAGSGESRLTWQAAAGIGYSTRWGDLFATWRTLAYEFDGGRLDDLDFSGPAVGIAFDL